MPKGLKSTSSPIQISQRIRATTDATAVVNAEERVDLQLNPLDNEVFVVTGVKIDFTNATLQPDTAVGRHVANQACSVSKIQLAGTPGIDNPSVIASSKVSCFIQNDPQNDQYTAIEQNPMDAPPSSMDYLDIIATNDFYLNLLLSDNFATGQTTGCDVRVYGYRATADASTYAALVQSEMLSR